MSQASLLPLLVFMLLHSPLILGLVQTKQAGELPINTVPHCRWHKLLQTAGMPMLAPQSDTAYHYKGAAILSARSCLPPLQCQAPQTAWPCRVPHPYKYPDEACLLERWLLQLCSQGDCTCREQLSKLLFALLSRVVRVTKSALQRSAAGQWLDNLRLSRLAKILSHSAVSLLILHGASSETTRRVLEAHMGLIWIQSTWRLGAKHVHCWSRCRPMVSIHQRHHHLVILPKLACVGKS